MAKAGKTLCLYIIHKQLLFSSFRVHKPHKNCVYPKRLPATTVSNGKKPAEHLFPCICARYSFCDGFASSVHYEDYHLVIYILKQSCDSTLDYKEPFFSVYAHQRFVRKNNNPRFNFCIFAAYRWGLVVHYLWEEEGGILLGSHFQNLDWFWRVIYWWGSVAWRVILINSMTVIQSSNEHELKLNETTVKIIHQS